MMRFTHLIMGLAIVGIFWPGSALRLLAADDAAWEEYFRQAIARQPQAVEQWTEMINARQAELSTASREDKKQIGLELRQLRRELAGLKKGTFIPPVVVGIKLQQGSIGVLHGPDIEVEIVEVIDENRALGKVYGNDVLLDADTSKIGELKRIDLSRDVVVIDGNTTYAPALGAGVMVPVVKVIPPEELKRRTKDYLKLVRSAQ